MKNTFILIMICTGLSAQVNTTAKYLDKNKVKARINTTNDKFWNIYGNGSASYEVPKGSGKNAMFANSIWIGGLDGGGQLHIAANTYKQNGTDFWSGPLDTTNGNASSPAPYDKLWKIDCGEILSFVTAFNSGAVAANTYTIPPDILSYPGNGGGGFQSKMEPFVDADANGVYNPYAGDYPLIKGHQQILSIYNDKYSSHAETGAPGMGIEIHEHSFVYSEPAIHDSMQAINYTTFYQYTIYNRSSTNYNNVYIADWSDVDVGYFLNDYIGSDTINNFAYCYNSGSNDPSGLGVNGYGNYPPVSSHAILPNDCSNDGIDNDSDGQIDESGEQFRMNKVTYYNNNLGSVLPQTTNPSIGVDYYSYMQGLWKDFSPFTFGGNAYGGSTPSGFVYPGDPQYNLGWTESQAGNPPGDRRVLISSGPFNFPPGSKIEWGYAIVFSQDSLNPVNTITQFHERVQRDVKNVKYYYTTHQNTQCSSPSTPVGLNENKERGLNAVVYPNPANSYLNVDIMQNIVSATVELFDVLGRQVATTHIQNGYHAQIDITTFEHGIYILKIKSDKGNMTQKVIKN